MNRLGVEIPMIFLSDSLTVNDMISHVVDKSVLNFVVYRISEKTLGCEREYHVHRCRRQRPCYIKTRVEVYKNRHA